LYTLETHQKGDAMLQLSIGEEKKSKLKRIPCCPRFGMTLGLMGYHFELRYASVVETAYNSWLEGFGKKSLLDTAITQLKEIDFKRPKRAPKRPSVEPSHARKAKRNKLVPAANNCCVAGAMLQGMVVARSADDIKSNKAQSSKLPSSPQY
jgi:hypothetical protein